MQTSKLLWQKIILYIHGGIHCYYLQKIAVAVFLCLCLASCVQISMVDVSSTPEYLSVVGKQFRAKEDLWAFGIMSEIDYPKKVDYIVLMNFKIAGREVVTEERLNRGFIFRVVRVLKAKSSLLSRMRYIVEIVDSNKFKGNEVRVRLTGGFNDGNYGLDKSVYSLEN